MTTDLTTHLATDLTTTIDVRFYELDPYGHVNHGVYLNYFEVARVELLERIGFGLPRMQELGFHIVVVEAHVRFHRPAVANDRLTVHSAIGRLGRASSTWHQRLVRGEELLATNRVRAAITGSDGRPTAPPPELAEAMRALRDPAQTSLVTADGARGEGRAGAGDAGGDTAGGGAAEGAGDAGSAGGARDTAGGGAAEGAGDAGSAGGATQG